MKKMITIILSCVILLMLLYITLIYSNISFIAKWRTIYIETAMSTMTKQWLATSFIPKSVIDEVMSNRDKANAKIDSLLAQWQDVRVFKPEEVVVETVVEVGTVIDPKDVFLEKYWELDKGSFDEYINNNPEVLVNGYDNLYINKSKLEDKGTTIKTIMGETVLAIDAKNNILIVEVKEEGYNGRLAIIKDPSQVKMGSASRLGTIGERMKDIVKNNNAILGVNASGFQDINWEGNGGTVVGLYIKDGKVINKTYGSSWVMIGFDKDNNLRIGKYKDISIFRDAIEFRPPLVLNGERVVEDTAGWGLQPRTSIGQTDKGEILLLTIDGRQIGWSIGATMEQCANVMLKHKALQAAAVDGGSSTIMVYEDEVINKPASNPLGRHLPNAFIVMPAEKGLANNTEIN